MRFKLFRAVLNKEISQIIAREALKQKLNLVKPSKKELKQLAALALITKRGIPPHLVRKKLPDNLGYGIFLHPNAKPLLKGELIGPYAGEVSLIPQNAPDDSAYAFEPLSDITLTKEEQALFGNGNRYHPRRLYWLSIDAEKKGNFTRFINHSAKPNLIAELFSIPPNTLGLAPAPIEVIYLAKKTIQPGEQLLVDYEGDDNSYWASIGIKPQSITPRTFRLDASLNLIK